MPPPPSVFFNFFSLYLLDKQRTFDRLECGHIDDFCSVQGKTVRIRRGPAAVTGDETCSSHCTVTRGKAQGLGRSGSQKTLLNDLHNLFGT